MFHFGYVTYWQSLVKSVQLSVVLSLAILAFPFVVWNAALPKAEKLALTGFYLPILTLFFYHNTAPYFYVYMLPPVTVACGVVFAVLVARYRAIAVATLLLLGGSFVLYKEPPNPIERQRQILRVAETMFPGGVAYFDSCAMLGSFPKANVFMTPWGIDQYLLGGFPSLEETMASKPSVGPFLGRGRRYSGPRKRLCVQGPRARFLHGARRERHDRRPRGGARPVRPSRSRRLSRLDDGRQRCATDLGQGYQGPGPARCGRPAVHAVESCRRSGAAASQGDEAISQIAGDRRSAERQRRGHQPGGR